MAVNRADINFLSDSITQLKRGFLEGELKRQRDKQLNLRERIATETKEYRDEELTRRKSQDTELNDFRDEEQARRITIEQELREVRNAEEGRRVERFADEQESEARKLKRNLDEWGEVAMELGEAIVAARAAGDEPRAQMLEGQVKVIDALAKSKLERLQSGQPVVGDMVEVNVSGPNGTAKLAVPAADFNANPERYLGTEADPTFMEKQTEFQEFINQEWTTADGRTMTLVEYYRRTRNADGSLRGPADTVGKNRRGSTTFVDETDERMERLLEEAEKLDPMSGQGRQQGYDRDELQAEMEKRGLNPSK